MAFYTRTIEIDGVVYKQIGPTQWQNLKTGETIDNTKLTVLVNQFKQKRLTPSVTPPTPSGGPTGACCEVVNGIMQCSVKTQEACSGGCFKGAGTICNITEEQPDPCSTCVHCCFVGAGCIARTPSACLAAGGTYFAFGQGCTACKFGVCSSDTVVTQRFYGNGCTGTFVVGGGPASFDLGVFCTGSGLGQTCGSTGFRYQELTPNFIAGATCSSCVLGSCCTGGTCLGGTLTSQAACSTVGGLFFAGQTCGQCDFGVYCTGAGNDRTCIRTGFRGEQLSSEFQAGATCSRCIMGTCCVNGDRQVGVRQSDCTGTFFSGIFNQNACDTGSCCVGATCNENIFRYNCTGVFNSGLTCIACSNGACCLPGGGCTLTTMGTCMATGGTFFGGATCSACDTGVCCNNGNCTDQRRGRGCTGTFYVGVQCNGDPCSKGSCCTSGNCISNTEQINCENLNGTFFRGLDCSACATGANCLTDIELNGDRVCVSDVFQGSVEDGSFYQGQGCSACESGACCGQSGGGIEGIRGDCSGSSVFFKGQTLFICNTGVFCTGSQQGQTCFGLGFRGQSLTNNFIAGATCSSCILGACCTGGTCLGGGLTSQAACSVVGGLFYAGRTCTQCDFGVYCTGATCFGLGFRGQSLTNNFIAGATCSSCILGACCTGGTCSGGGQTSQAACNALAGLFYPGATCRTCDFGVYCTGATCFEFGFRGQSLTNNFIAGATCSSCILGACCTGGTCLGGGQTSQAACALASGTFYVGATCTQCVTGVFCTGSGLGQTCFGLGHRGQSLTNNFIAGATCSSCILGACCTGGTCLGGGLTSQAACSVVGGLFYAGTTCVSCDYGVYCTGSNETTSCLGLGYRAQNLSSQFIISGTCINDCVYGSCCDGITCLGITSQGNCPKPYNFFAGLTCGACDTGIGACCTGGSSSITTITGCNALGGIFFPEGTTALCVTGSCCTGGTCTQEIVGRSGNCQLFIAGATCGICDTGVYCTGATCFQLGFRGQSLTNNFIAGATCSSCILGICCTGGTCIGGGVTAEINCTSNRGSFYPGITQCDICAVNVNCCIGGTHSYVPREQCLQNGGIVFEGAEDSLLCESGAFCTGNTCIGVTLFGFNLGSTFIINADCDSCITGTCCIEEEVAYITDKETCNGTFYAGEYNVNICTAGLTYGICCVGGTCSSDVLQTECFGYFISNADATANSLSCGSNACQIGICCKETGATAATGGTCLGTMTRAACALTGGDFFSSADGYTCSNCTYTPMLASVLLKYMAVSFNSPENGISSVFDGNETGFTGNEIQPRYEIFNVVNNTFITYRDLVLYGTAGTTLITNKISGTNNSGNSRVIRHRQPNFRGSGRTAFSPWYNSGITFLEGSTANQYLTGISGSTAHDYSPVFGTGITNAFGKTMGYIVDSDIKAIFEMPRYIKLTLGYGNPGDSWHGTELVYRQANYNPYGNNQLYEYALTDATIHAELTNTTRNVYPASEPLLEYAGNTLGLDPEHSSPILWQSFAENPLKYRVRPVGSCCVGATCIGIITKDHCMVRGGTFNENKKCSSCYPTKVFGNCCAGGTHAGYTSLAKCNELSGTFFEGTTYDNNVCIYGTICTEDRQCYQGFSFSYYGAFSQTNNKFFIEQSFGSTQGCAACDAGLCCVGSTCMGKISRIDCYSMGGTVYYNENTCQTNCDLGVCCDIAGGCGTYTNRANCYGQNQAFVVGATQGATCSACSSLLRLTSSGSGVTFTMVLNKGTTHGAFHDGSYWVQETDNLRVLNVKLEYPNADASKTFSYSANTRLGGLTLTPGGYKGSVYIHGAIRNPMALRSIDKIEGVVGNPQPFTSIIYDNYDGGWKGPFDTTATDTQLNYDNFNLTKFVSEQNAMKYSGMTLVGGDVLVCNATNFDIDNPLGFLPVSGGFAYQVQKSRANTLAYGILNCLSKTRADLAGSTTCFRPPITWPTEDRLNRPIYPLSRLDSRIPGMPGMTLIQVSSRIIADKDLSYNANTARTPAQFSEFGDGTDYGVPTPMWAMAGPRTQLSSYGEQYVSPIQKLFEAVHATGTVNTNLTFEQRKNGIARITQYGIDAFGPHKIYCQNMGSGAGQKAGRTRPWIPIAGYYLGETAMYDPEATMLEDSDRLNHLLTDGFNYKTFNLSFNDDSVCVPADNQCATRSNWIKFRHGDTGPENNYRGLRRYLARMMSHEAQTMIEYIDDPSNLVRHYAYPGTLYRETLISGFSSGGETGITFFNELKTVTLDTATTQIPITGNFGVIRWGSGTGAPNPYPGRFSYSTKEGTGDAFASMWIRVESGPGSSGPSGATASRFYKLIYATGFRSDLVAEPISNGGGWQLVLGQTWADGIPDHTSVLKLYPMISVDAGITRPSSFDALGYTFGPVGFLINNHPLELCGGCSRSSLVGRLFDANTGSAIPYFINSLDAWGIQYLFMDYITKTRGVTIISDAIPCADYLKQYVYTSPYNMMSLFPWYSGTSAVFNTWLGVNWNDLNQHKNRINFAQYYPGVLTWRGLTV